MLQKRKVIGPATNQPFFIRFACRLTREEQIALSRLWRTHGDVDARDKLCCSFVHLVAYRAQLYARKLSCSQADLLSEGMIGLYTAVCRFDPDYGTAPITYVMQWINGYMLRYVVDNRSMVNVAPRKAQSLYFKHRKAMRDLARRGILEPTDEVVARQMGISRKELDWIRREWTRRDVALEDMLPAQGEGNRTFHDVLEDDGVSAEASAITADLRRFVRGRLCGMKLNGREKRILEDRLLADHPTPLRVLGKSFGLSGERIRQIERDLERRLRALLWEVA